MISFLLNLPYTLAGILFALIHVPKSIKWDKSHQAIICSVRASFPVFWLLKGWRGITMGNAIVLNLRGQELVLKHELVHIRQYKKFPFIFPFMYALEILIHGYRENKYEKEAYEKAGNHIVMSELK